MTPTAPTRWLMIRPGSWGTHNGWNAWKRSDGQWNLRNPRGEYRTFPTLRAAKTAADYLTRQEQPTP